MASAATAIRVDLRRIRPMPTPGHLPTTRLGQIDRLPGAPMVSVLQLLLRRYYVTIRADGSYGPQTRAAVLAFQRRVGRPSTGAVDTNDWVALLVRSRAELGGRGNHVRAVQMLLNHRLTPSAQIIEDGVFGLGTLMLVQDAQRGAGLPVTRVVDLATHTALIPH